ncbi:MAG: alpha/beta hydrolase [Thermodesulfobacteriota bacterium]
MTTPARWISGRQFFAPLHRAVFGAVSLGSARVAGARFREVDRGGVSCLSVEGSFAEGGGLVLFFHGGGYMAGGMSTHRNGVAYLCRAANMRGLVPGYRRTPENGWPAAVDDAFAVYEAELAEGTDPGRVAVCGDSAGGGLALALCLRLRERGLSLPGALYLLSPWVDLVRFEKSHTFARTGRRTPLDWSLEALAVLYARDEDLCHPEISPLYADLAGMPPMLVQAGTNEIMRDDARRLSRKAEECGVEVRFEPYPGPVHVLPFFTRVSGPGRELLGRGGEFIREKTGANP